MSLQKLNMHVNAACIFPQMSAWILHCLQKIQKLLRSGLRIFQSLQPDSFVFQELLFPAIQGRNGYSVFFADIAYRILVGEVFIQDTDYEGKAVKAVRNYECREEDVSLSALTLILF